MKAYKREIMMDGSSRIFFNGRMLSKDEEFWVENGREFTPIPLEAPTSKEVHFTPKTLHGLYILLCFCYFAFNYGLFKAYTPDFIEKKARAAMNGHNSYGWDPTN